MLHRRAFFDIHLSTLSTYSTRTTLCVLLELYESVLMLCYCWPIWQKLGVTIDHIESRESKENAKKSKDYYIEFPSQAKDEETILLTQLREVTAGVTVYYPNTPSSVTDSLNHGQEQGSNEATIPWFPRNIRDLKKCCTTLYKFGHDLSSDHPVSIYWTLGLKGYITYQYGSAVVIITFGSTPCGIIPSLRTCVCK